MELSQLIADAHVDWLDWPVERAVFGTDDPDAIAAEVESFCAERLGSRAIENRFYESSVGSVFGLRLSDGREVVLKAHQPKEPRGLMVAVQTVQRHLAEHGFGCPRPILEPTSCGRGHVTVEELCDEGDWADAHDPAVRRALAELLARLVKLARGFVGLPGLRPGLLSRIRPGGIWPVPHSTIFDFEATAGGAEWIDAFATRAQELLRRPHGDRVVGHVDWSVKHFRFREGMVSATYDWDSLAVAPEPVIVGEAARSFTVTWRVPTRLAPSLEESRAFVSEYEAARGSPFTPLERETLGAAAAYGLAYTARCEHCLGPGSVGGPLEALATHGEELFHL